MVSVGRILRDYRDAGSVNGLLALWGFVDDSTFLTRPFTYSRLFTRGRPGNRNAGWSFCDPDVARREVEYAYPGNKYGDGK